MPSQLHRFIELIKEHKINLTDKFVTQITTSKHFYDVTAHCYIQDNCQDLKMKYIKGLSADMDDLTLMKGQKELKDFFEYVLWSIENDQFEPLPIEVFPYKQKEVTIPSNKTVKQDGNIVIVTDFEEDDSQLINMIARFQSSLTLKSKIVNLRKIRIDGDCC